MNSTRNLPFYNDDLNGGFMKVEGILRLEGDFLCVDYQKKDTVLGAYRSELKSVKIPVSGIDLAEFRKKWFSARLTLHAKRADVFKDFPGSSLTKRVLKIKKEDRSTAASLSSNLNLRISEQKLREMDE